MHPKLGQAIVSNTNGQGSTFGVVEVDGTGTACPVGIKFDSIVTEAHPVTATCIDLSVVWSTLWSAESARVGLEVDVGQGPKINNHITFFQQFFAPVSIAIPPQETAPGIQVAVIVKIEVEIINAALLNGLELCPVDMHHKQACCTGQTVVGYHLH